MSWFDVLFLLSGLAMLIALVRMRPALLIVAGNEAITLRALSNIYRYGKPVSQELVPGAVFGNDNLAIAAHVFAITTLLTLLFSLLPARQRESDPMLLPRLPTWVLTLLVIYFLVLTFSQRTILTQTYTDPTRGLYDVNLGGGTAFLNSIFLYEIVRRTMTGALKRSTGFTIVFLLFLGTDYLHGSTGLATGFVIVAALLIFSSARPARRLIIVSSLLLGLFLLSFSIRLLRSSFSTGDTQVVAQVAGSMQQASAREQRTAEGIESMGNGTQYAAHVLECISLYEAGESRQWKSIYRPLIYTFQPSFLVRALGIERPKEAAWELADYFIHGGGIFVIGELYWNGGYLCVLLVFFGLAWVCWKSDVSYRSGFAGLMMACHIGCNLLQGTGYGFAQVSRGMINGLLSLLIYGVARALAGGRRGAHGPAPSGVLLQPR